MFRLRARPNRARMAAITELARWLQDVCKVDPAEPCRGSTAVQVLFGRLVLEHGNTAASYHGDHLLVGKGAVFAPEDIREYIWGISQEVVTVSDEDMETTQELDGPELLEGAEEEPEVEELEETEEEDGQE